MLTIKLPFPVSVNEMYVNKKGRGKGRHPSKKFVAWTDDSGWCLVTQLPLHLKFEGRVDIEIKLDDRRQGDCDSRIKCVLDLLVKHQIIVDDRKKFVRSVKSEWASLDECTVTISSIDGD